MSRCSVPSPISLSFAGFNEEQDSTVDDEMSQLTAKIATGVPSSGNRLRRTDPILHISFCRRPPIKVALVDSSPSDPDLTYNKYTEIKHMGNIFPLVETVILGVPTMPSKLDVRVVRIQGSQVRVAH